MQEIELKFDLDGAQEKRLRSSAVVKQLSEGPAVTESLWSVYYDTPDHALRAEGTALRLRRVQGEWVQTVKCTTGAMANGLSNPFEIEYEVSGQNLDLTRIPDHDLREHLIGLSRAGLVPVVETRFRRTRRMLTLPDGSVRAEFAIDKGTLSSGDTTQAFTEAEFELKDGTPSRLYELAQRVMTLGPIRFAQASKSERALALSQPDLLPTLRKARRVDLSNVSSVEEAAILILTEGLSHAAPNIAMVLESENMNGPHQMRVGLRRLRSALSAFRPALGREALAPIGEQAQFLAAQAGHIRDLDVLAEEIVAAEAQANPAEPGHRHLIDAIRAHRELVRAQVRKTLAQPQRSLFPLDLASFIANRGWVDGADYTQTTRLSQPVLPFARKVLDKRWKAVRLWGDRIETLTIDERHEMRKDVKKLRYLVDAFRTLFDPDDVAAFNRGVKRLQKAFGALNDSAMAELVLMAPDAPGIDDPLAQRSAGRIIGKLLAQSDALWPAAIDDWHSLSESGRFWRR
ncbi:MAG: CHAD domain-containing protein [Pseudomonadota bacterium]